MSKRTIEKVIAVCDFCGEDGWYVCLLCGKDFCFDCAKKYAKEYASGLYQSASPRYCNGCDLTLKSMPRLDRIHDAFVSIERLRQECATINASLDKRRVLLEEYLKKLMEERGLRP